MIRIHTTDGEASYLSLGRLLQLNAKKGAFAFDSRRQPTQEQLEQVYSDIDSKRELHLRALVEFLKQPSISATGNGIAETAAMVQNYLKDTGFQVCDVIATKGHPIVYGEFNAGRPKTYIIYSMYDTQPIDDADSWTAPPLSATILPRKLPCGMVEVIYNRGACNQKGPLLSFLMAVKSILAIEGNLPVNLKIIVEGEEELGSIHLADFVNAHKDRLAEASGTCFPHFSEATTGRAAAYLGCKGMVYLEIECSGDRWGRGPVSSDIHGSQKAWVDSPLWRLVDALSTITQNNGKEVTIEGICDRVAKPTPEDEQLLRNLANLFDPTEIRQKLNIGQFMVDEKDRYNLLKTFMFSTTANLDGLWGGYIGPGSKTILPHKGQCRMDIRLVPNQNPHEIAPLLRSHFDKHGFGDVAIKVKSAYKWSRTSVKERVVQALINCYKEFGKTEVEVWPRIAGTAPFYLFNEVLNAPVVMGGLGHGTREHTTDEYIVWKGNDKLGGFDKATKFFARYLYELAS